MAIAVSASLLPAAGYKQIILMKPPQFPATNPPQIPHPKTGDTILHQGLVVIFRLLLLTVGGGAAFVTGGVIAHFFPARNPQPPAIASFFRSTSQLIRFRFQPANPQQRLQSEIEQIQNQYQQLSDRLTQLETQLGLTPAHQPLDARFQRLQAQTAHSGVLSTPPNVSAVITLPSDVLFPQGQALLDRTPLEGTAAARQELLDNVVGELKNHQNATIRISAFTDDVGDEKVNLERSWQQATAIHHYLIQTLGDRHRYVIMGFGESRPLVANENDSQRQRNRRVEIAVN